VTGKIGSTTSRDLTKLKTDPHFIPEAPERPQRPRRQWSLGSMFLLAFIVCGLAWMTKFAVASDAPMEVYLAIAATAVGALFGLYQGNVLRYAAWTFVLTVTVIVVTNWVVRLQQAIEIEAHPNAWEPIPGKPGYFRNENGGVLHP
jgi:hypothetical protein